MRRNTEEVKAELSRRLDEYKEKRRVRRKTAALCVTVCLCAAITVTALPAMVALNKKSDGADVYHAGISDKLDDITEQYASDVQTDVIIKIESADPGVTEIIVDGESNCITGSKDDMHVKFRDLLGLSGAKSEAIICAYEALDLERIEEFSGEVILTFEILCGDAETVILELTDKDELIINGTAHTANNIQILKDALKDTEVLE